MRRVKLLAALLLCLVPAAGQAAEDYPTRPITIVVPFPPGAGGTDAIARVLAERMRAALGQALVVENVGGAGGSIGVARVTRAQPDGYTLSIGNWGSHVGASAAYPVKYDVLTDLVPVAYLGANPMWIVVRNELPAKTLPELVAWLKGNADKAAAGTVGVGSGAHLCIWNVQQAIGLQFPLVPYKGGSDAMQDLLGGHIDLMCDQASNSLPLARTGKIRPVAVMAHQRWFAAPDVPASDEAGLAGLDFDFFFGLWAPKGTPSAVVDKLNAAVRASLADPAVRQRLAELGLTLPSVEQQTPGFLSERHRGDAERWWPKFKAANAKQE